MEVFADLLTRSDFIRLAAPQYAAYAKRWSDCIESVQLSVDRLPKHHSINYPAMTREYVDRRFKQWMVMDVIYEHYRVGDVFDYHGVAAMVEDVQRGGEVGKNLEVIAVVKAVDAGLQRITIKTPLALRLIWRRYGVEDLI